MGDGGRVFRQIPQCSVPYESYDTRCEGIGWGGAAGFSDKSLSVLSHARSRGSPRRGPPRPPPPTLGVSLVPADADSAEGDGARRGAAGGKSHVLGERSIRVNGPPDSRGPPYERGLLIKRASRSPTLRNSRRKDLLINAPLYERGLLIKRASRAGIRGSRGSPPRP